MSILTSFQTFLREEIPKGMSDNREKAARRGALEASQKKCRRRYQKTDRQIATLTLLLTPFYVSSLERTLSSLGEPWFIWANWHMQKTNGIRRNFRVKPTAEIELRIPGVPRTRLIAPAGCVDEKRCEDRVLDAESRQKNTTNSKNPTIYSRYITS